ncbi:MAG: glycoside hydrolase family 88 protein [Prolixibacteraceae bacterium]|jgi:unsaturated chondroitin disaccharide hydrolase|nr:glycoside hydrolase family 88 protein [Prolixibacteraceae bacterium]
MIAFFKNKLLAFTVVMLLFSSCAETEKTGIDEVVKENLEFSEKQMSNMLEWLGNSSMSPRTVEDGATKLVKSGDWTSGFFPGSLWMAYEYSRDPRWRDNADHYSMNIEMEKMNGGTHDMGFKMYSSFGNGYRLTNNNEYKQILLQSAKTLTTRFNPKVGAIRSWDHNKDKWDYPVIVDNMLNLELLFWASRETRDSSYYKIAVSHAEKTLENHFRNDYSSYHVVSYDTITGEPVKKNTHQGYSHESSWARGQAWGLYGFTMTYRETGKQVFLDQACKIAGFILNHPNLPEDKIPYWDFDTPGIPDEPRDASAAAVICSALYELSLYCDGDEKEYYLSQADQILRSLSSPEYRAEPGKNNFFLLKHSTGNYPKNSEIDEPINYADYYFMEANLRRLKLSGNWVGEKAAVIIKADDLVYDKKTSVPAEWKRFAKIALQKNCKVAPGIVGSSLEKGDTFYFNWIKKQQKTGLFEFWNHGQLHKRWEKNGERQSDFYNISTDEQMAYLQQTQQLGKEKLGIEFKTFGAPYNWTDENTVKALEQFPELKVWFYGPRNAETSKVKVERIPALNIEYPVHHPNFYHFFNSYYFFSTNDVVAIQGHPLSWDDNGFKQIEMMIDYLQRIGAPIVLPFDLI